MDNFAAIDFETANNERTSVCSVGVVIVKDGEIVDKFYSLIHPEPDYYLYWNTRVHGLTQCSCFFRSMETSRTQNHRTSVGCA